MHGHSWFSQRLMNDFLFSFSFIYCVFFKPMYLFTFSSSKCMTAIHWSFPREIRLFDYINPQ